MPTSGGLSRQMGQTYRGEGAFPERICMRAHGQPQLPMVNEPPSRAHRPGRVYPSTELPVGGDWRQLLPRPLELPCCVHGLQSQTLVPAPTQVTGSFQACDSGHTDVWVFLGARRNRDLSFDVHPPASSGLCSSWFQGDSILLQAVYWATSNPGVSRSPSS